MAVEQTTSGDFETFGRDSDWTVVARDRSDPREWLQRATVCPLLAQYHINHVGIMNGDHSLKVVRTEQSGSYMMVTIAGEGEVRVDGGWKRVGQGQAVLLPPFAMNAFHSKSDRWKFCWVRYLENRDVTPIATARSPVRGAFEHAPLLAAIEGLHAECRNGDDPAAQNLWTETIHHYVRRFARPRQGDERLWRVWSKAGDKLEYPWSLHELADLGNMSVEHLRRLSKKQLGRSPIQHLTFLRMKQARHLLGTTDEKIETIARSVGYESPFTFSNTFKKWIGLRPSDLR